jgi:hypothetical protein
MMYHIPNLLLDLDPSHIQVGWGGLLERCQEYVLLGHFELPRHE